MKFDFKNPIIQIELNSFKYWSLMLTGIISTLAIALLGILKTKYNMEITIADASLSFINLVFAAFICFKCKKRKAN